MARRRRIRQAVARVFRRSPQPTVAPTVIVAAPRRGRARRVAAAAYGGLRRVGGGVRRIGGRAGRAVSYLRSKAMGSEESMGKMTFRNIATDSLMNAAGGVASSLLSAGARLTDNKWDDDPINQMAIKGAVGLGFKWLFKNRRGVHEFVAGVNGDAAGRAMDKWAISKLLPTGK